MWLFIDISTINVHGALQYKAKREARPLPPCAYNVNFANVSDNKGEQCEQQHSNSVVEHMDGMNPWNAQLVLR